MTTQFDVRHINNMNDILRYQCQSLSMDLKHPLANNTANDCHASAPTLSDLECDYQGNVQEDTTCCCPTFMNNVPDEIRKDIAIFLSSGDRHSLTSLTTSNVHLYRKCAEDLNLSSLKNILDTMNGNEYTHDTNMVNNTPAFEVIFPPLTNNNSQEVLVFDIRQNVTNTIDVKKLTRFGDGFAACVAYVQDCPYIIISGGYGKTQTLIEKYDVVRNKWTKRCDLKDPRTKHRMIFVNGNVYVIGGKMCNTIEKYDIAKNKSVKIATLPDRVHSFATAAYGDNVYIFGGKTQSGDVSCVQCLNTRTETVKCLPHNLPYKCSGGQAIVVNDTIYYATNHGHMIKFDPKTNQSELLSQQPYKRKHFAMFSNNDQLCIYGGIRTEGPIEQAPSSNSTNSMYTYSPEKDTWTCVSYDNKTIPVYSSCTVRFPKESPVKPFMKICGCC